MKQAFWFHSCDVLEGQINICYKEEINNLFWTEGEVVEPFLRGLIKYSSHVGHQQQTK